MGVYSATVGPTETTPLVMWSVGTALGLTQPSPIVATNGTQVRFVEIHVAGADGTLRIEWLPLVDFSPTIPLPLSVIVGTDPPAAAVLKNDMIIQDEASNEPLITDEMRRLLPQFEDPFTTVFAPTDRVPVDQLFHSADDEGFLGTVGDAVSVGAGAGALIGLVAGGPPGAAKGAAIGAGMGFSFGVGFYVGTQIAEAVA